MSSCQHTQRLTVVSEWKDGDEIYRLVDVGAGPNQLQVYRDGLWIAERPCYIHGVLCARIAAMTKKIITELRIAELKVRERNGKWAAGWWDERFSPSSASGDLGFYGDAPEDAVKALLHYVLDNTKGEARDARQGESHE